MNPVNSALKFILAQQRGRVSVPIQCETHALHIGKKKIRTLVYSGPVKAANPILFLHGMSVMGIDDPRQVAAAQALVAAGFSVICPELAEIRDLQIRAESVATFTALARAVQQNADLCPQGRLALFAPSFSGAIVLRAAAHPTLRAHVSAICCIGPMAGIRGSMENIFLAPGVDPYARFVVLANYLRFSKKYQALAKVFRALALDNWHKSTERAERALAQLTAAQKKATAKICDDENTRRQIFNDLMPYMEKELEAYAVLDIAKDIQAPTFLLHGLDDDVIPPQESIDLAQRVAKTKLVVSPFIGHADTKVSVRLVLDVWRLVSGFSYFFRHAAR